MLCVECHIGHRVPGCLLRRTLSPGSKNWPEKGLSCPLDALCPCAGVPHVLLKRLCFALSWENTVLSPADSLWGCLLLVPRGVLGRSFSSSQSTTWDIVSEQLQDCQLQTLWVLPFGPEPQEKRRVLPPLLIGPTAITQAPGKN